MKQVAAHVAVVGGGPAGLMVAQVLAQAGAAVQVFDAMPSVGRKFLLAGRGGLNLTHSEVFDQFLSRYPARRDQLESPLSNFGAEQVRAWAKDLGVDTFVGTSGRVFPTDMKAAPLLRAWLQRLRHPLALSNGEPGVGVQFHMRHRWLGWTGNPGSATQTLRFATPQGEVQQTFDAVVLALGGASWVRLGSDGAWVPLLAQRGVEVAALEPANCGFDIGGLNIAGAGAGWSEHFTSRHAGQPFKSVAVHFINQQGQSFQRKGEFVVTATGIEGSLIYAASHLLRDQITTQGQATLLLDLLPDLPVERVRAAVLHPRGSRSLSSHLKSRLGLEGIKLAVLFEVLGKEGVNQSEKLAQAIKALPLRLIAARPIDEAISSAGGVKFAALDAGLMVRALPGVFCAGEMLDWEAPTGGYLLTACLATGAAAGQGVWEFLNRH